MQIKIYKKNYKENYKRTMKFKLKQPTKFMHRNLENQKSDLSQEKQPGQPKQKQQVTSYKRKKIIKKKHEPSAVRLNKINETFQKIYNNSSKVFEDLNVDLKALNTLSETKIKHKCKCNKNVKFYCLKCMQKVTDQPFPSINLPFQITIIHHKSQKINKSSALPLTFLTNQVKFHFFSSLEQETNSKLWQELPKPGKNTYILFPHKKSKLIKQYLSGTQKQESNQIKNLIILDCTWFQTDQLVQILAKRGYYRFIRIEGYNSIYWRYNHHNDEALCSAEAITFFMRQYQKVIHQNAVKQQKNSDLNAKLTEKLEKNNNNEQAQIKKYDNLLFLYSLNLKMIIRVEQDRMKQNIEIQPLPEQV